MDMTSVSNFNISGSFLMVNTVVAQNFVYIQRKTTKIYNMTTQPILKSKCNAEKCINNRQSP